MELWTSHNFQLLFNLLGNLHRSTYVMQSACSLLTFKPKIILLYGVSLICCLLYFFLVLKFRFFFFFFCKWNWWKANKGGGDWGAEGWGRRRDSSIHSQATYWAPTVFWALNQVLGAESEQAKQFSHPARSLARKTRNKHRQRWVLTPSSCRKENTATWRAFFFAFPSWQTLTL